MKDFKKKLLSKTLGKHSYWTINKQLVRSIGLEATLILQHIIDLQAVFNKDEIFQSQGEMAKELGISEYAVKNRIPELIKLGLVSVVKKGVPCKNYYSTNDDKIAELLVNEVVDVKSTNLSVDFEINDTDDCNSPIQLVSNQLTSDGEIDTTNTKNTTQEPFTNNILNNTSAIADKRLTEIIDTMSSDYDVARKLLKAVVEDYGSLDRCLELFTSDKSVQQNYRKHFFNLTIK